MISQDELNEIFTDTSFNGEYIKFYEKLQNALDQYLDKEIDHMRNSIASAHEFLGLTREEVGFNPYEIDKMKVLYEYAKLI